VSRIVGDDKTHSLAIGAELVARKNSDVSVTDGNTMDVDTHRAIVHFCPSGGFYNSLTLAKRTDDMTHVIGGWLPDRSRLWRGGGRRWRRAHIVVPQPRAEEGGGKHRKESLHGEASLMLTVSKQPASNTSRFTNQIYRGQPKHARRRRPPMPATLRLSSARPERISSLWSGELSIITSNLS
jgi:hypothetical protein